MPKNYQHAEKKNCLINNKVTYLFSIQMNLLINLNFLIFEIFFRNFEK